MRANADGPQCHWQMRCLSRSSNQKAVSDLLIAMPIRSPDCTPYRQSWFTIATRRRCCSVATLTCTMIPLVANRLAIDLGSIGLFGIRFLAHLPAAGMVRIWRPRFIIIPPDRCQLLRLFGDIPHPFGDALGRRGGKV